MILTGGNPYARLIEVEPISGAGMIGIYEMREPGEIPEPSTMVLIGAGLLFGSLRLRRSSQS